MNWQKDRVLTALLLSNLIKCEKEYEIVKEVSEKRDLCIYYLKKEKLEEALKYYDGSEDLKG